MQLTAYLNRWQLNNPIKLAETKTSLIYKVDYKSVAAVLKLLTPIGVRSESRGADALRYFNGKGAVDLLMADRGAHLLSFIDGSPLTVLAEGGQDESCIVIIAQVLRSLHSSTVVQPKSFITMAENFESLFIRAERSYSDPMLQRGAAVARELLSSEAECVVLHGDIHHGNIMHCSQRGWLAIGPKCLVGEPAYDTANAFYNPIGLNSGLLEVSRIQLYKDGFSKALKMQPKRILQYAFSYGCLSACWDLEDGIDPKVTLRIVKIIETLL